MSVVDYISNLDRPSYAPSFDGVYFDGTILGYRTTGVEGRNSYQSSAAELSSEIKDGALFARNVRQPRDLTVKFAITTDSAEELHTSADKLKGMVTHYSGDQIEKTEFKVIFDDESDKFYKGVITDFTLDNIVDDKNASGQFTIHCADPFKYSVETFTAVGVPNSEDRTVVITVDYDGTLPSYPSLQATCTYNTGFVGFVNQNGKVIQVGLPDEIELIEEESQPSKSEVIFPKTGESDTAFGTVNNVSDFSTKWQVNPLGMGDPSDNVMRVSDKFCTTGTAAYGGYIAGNNVHATDYGNYNEGWHGPVVTRLDSYFEDSNHSSQHRSGTLEFKHAMTTGANDYGEFVATLDHHIVEDNTVKRVAIAKIVFFKKVKGSNTSTCNLMTYSNTSKGGKLVHYFTFDSGSTGETTKETKVNNAGPATHKITKIDDQIIFEINGTPYSYRDTEIRNLTIDGVSFAFAKHKDVVPISKNLLYSAKFTSHSVTNFKDIPNWFSAGDSIVADASSGKISVNGTTQYGVGALGNDWETFYLSPGINVITCTYSELQNVVPLPPVPGFSLTYRKVYL